MITKEIAEKFDALVTKWWFWVLWVLVQPVIVTIGAYLVDRNLDISHLSHLSHLPTILAFSAIIQPVGIAASMEKYLDLNLDWYMVYYSLSTLLYFTFLFSGAVYSTRKEQGFRKVALALIAFMLLNTARCISFLA